MANDNLHKATHHNKSFSSQSNPNSLSSLPNEAKAPQKAVSSQPNEIAQTASSPKLTSRTNSPSPANSSANPSPSSSLANSPANSEPLIKRLELLTDKIAKTDTAFSSRFNEIMKFQNSLKEFQAHWDEQINAHKIEVNNLKEALSNSQASLVLLQSTDSEFKDSFKSQFSKLATKISGLEKDMLALTSAHHLQAKTFQDDTQAAATYLKEQKKNRWLIGSSLFFLLSMVFYFNFLFNLRFNDMEHNFDTLSKNLPVVNTSENANLIPEPDPKASSTTNPASKTDAKSDITNSKKLKNRK